MPDVLTNLWGLWKSTGISTIVESPKAVVQWNAAGSGAAAICGAGDVEVNVFNPVTSSIDVLGNLTITGSESDSQFITAVYNAIKTNVLGYKVALLGDMLYVKAPTGGSNFNGQSVGFSGSSGGTGTTPFFGGGDVPADTGIVSQWNDESGNGHHLVSEAGYNPVKITNRLNGYPSVRKDGIWNNAWLRTAASLPDEAELTVYIVAKHVSVLGNAQDRYLDSTTYYGLNIFGGATSITGQYKSVGGTKTIGSTFFTFRGAFKDADSSVSLNNDTPATNAFSYVTGYTPTRLSVFAAADGGNFGDKEIVEIRIYNVKHDADTIAAIENFLHDKYRHYDISTTISLPPLASKTVGDADFDPGATSDSPAPIVYSSSDNSIASIIGGKVHISAPGSVVITASQNSTAGFSAPAPVSQTLVISAQSQATAAKKFPAGLWIIDGIDIWTTFGVILEDGSADFLKYPPKKESTTHDWGDANGVDVDLQRIFFGQREGVLNFAIFANSTQEYFDRHDAFINLWLKPGTRRLEIAAHNNRSYFIYYKETNNYSQIANLKPVNPLSTYKIAHKFSMVVVEPEPKIYPGNVFIVVNDGKFLIS